MTTEQTITGTRDVVYDLVSVLYHALQGAEIYEKYAEDAFRAGEEEYAHFFTGVRDEEHRRADRAKELLARALTGSGPGRKVGIEKPIVGDEL
jgi:rubrerythrin